MKPRSWTLGVDIAETEGAITGVGRYTLDLLTAWLETETRPDIVLFARRASQVPQLLREHFEVVSSESFTGVVRWQQLTLPRLLRRRPVDLLFAPAYAIPLLSSTRSVVALHDLSFERDPAAFSWRERTRRRVLARRSAQRAAGILTISHFSKQEIMELYGVPDERIQVAVPSWNQAVFNPGQQSAAPANDPREHTEPPFLLAVGTVLRRRHLDVAIQAFARLSPAFDRHHLVIVGENRARPPLDLAQLAKSLHVEDRVRFLPRVRETQLVELYRSADLFISLSDYEGFGLPTLEAVACGSRALLFASETARELWDGLLPMTDSLNPQAVANAVEEAAAAAPLLARQPGVVDQTFDRQKEAATVLGFLADRR